MNEIISIFKKSAEIKVKFAEENAAKIEQVSGVIVNALHKGGKILLFGNGGSAADAQHIAAEVVMQRPFLKLCRKVKTICCYLYTKDF